MRGRPDACVRACRGAKSVQNRFFWHFEASALRSKTCGRAARGRCWRATNLVPPLPVDSASSEAGATGPQRKGTGRRVAVGVRASQPRAGPRAREKHRAAICTSCKKMQFSTGCGPLLALVSLFYSFINTLRRSTNKVWP